jgi:hypothetical protein
MLWWRAVLRRENRSDRIESDDLEVAAANAMSFPDVKIFCIVTSQGVVTLLYLYVFRFSAGFGMLCFWPFGLSLLLIAIVDSLLVRTRPGDPNEVVDAELRAEFRG